MTLKILAFATSLLATMTISKAAFAISEDSFVVQYPALVQPHFDQGVAQELTGVGGVKLSCRSWTLADSRGAIVLAIGYSEFAEKYAELIYDLNAAGYSVYLLEHRGMGYSQRLTANPQMVHVEKFANYVKDFEQFVAAAVPAVERTHLYLVGHSLGGLIALSVAHEHPEMFRAMALSAPLFEMNTGEYSEWFSLAYASWNVLIGQGAAFAPGQGEWDPNTASFPTTTTTGSEVRYNQHLAIYRRDARVVMGGASNNWVKEILTAANHVPQTAQGLAVPTLLMQAGNDDFARPARQDSFCKAVATCRLLRFEESKHEILMERDFIRSEALAAILGLFEAH